MRNARVVVLEQLDALAPQAVALGLEVLVVDDASTDGTEAVVQEWIDRHAAPGFRLLRRDRRGGPNASRNTGTAAATAHFLLFCDGDDVVAPGWAAAMLAARRDDAILCGALENLDPAQMARTWPLPPSVWGVPFAFGGNMALSRPLVERLGGFDEEVRAGGTEFDLCYRAQRDLDVPIVPVPDAIVRYRFPNGPARAFTRQIRRERGRCYLRAKFGPEVVHGRSGRTWLREWVDVARQLAASPRDASTRSTVATRAGSLVGRLIWSVRFRVRFL